ncbi:hypothetical protein DLAC_06073 [Tieghemostelium lacteum]|uniref:IPT/TIG domain-containing protein n=1 Tax=Tieghemostelium lacteum TaxID=361077 RepID=A0A151ZHD6_TIELA|nr:hypothetical protein DLAC_06073 [Tieghemostelium lacteum]|eukprot:KYQ93392.1 hypothetical protein DLAC_06073 [Tieghemostelium lacteum]
MNGFLQKPIGSTQQGPIGMIPNMAPGDPKLREALYTLSQVIEKMDSNQFDDIIYYQTKQLRQPLDMDDRQSLQQISSHTKVPMDYLEAIGRVSQSYYLYELLTQYCTEEHLSKISDALTVVFPVPLDGTEDQDILSSTQTIFKTQNYLSILQKLQQLFSKTPIDSLLHLQQQGSTEYLTQQQICETLDMKSDEYFLATSVKVLLQTDEQTLTTLVDSFPKFQSIQLIQLSLLPFKNIYEILDLKSNLCNLTQLYQIYPSNQPQPVALVTHYPVPNAEKKVELKIVEQPPERAVYRRNVKPYPAVMFDADSKLLNGNYYVNATLLRCNNFKEEPTYLSGNKLTQVGNSRVVTFRKLKVLITSHQQGESLFCFRFDLRKYNSDPEQNPNDFELVSSVHSNPICILSHSSQMKHSFVVDLPKVTEIVPIDGPCTGGTRVAILGANFADSPGIRLKFDNIEVIPEFHSQGTLTCYAPEHAPGTVQVKVSNSPKVWSSTFAHFTYMDSSSINVNNQQELNMLNLPKSVFGLDFSSSFTNFSIKDSSQVNLPSNPHVFRSTGKGNFINELDHNGYSLVHYSLFLESMELFNQLYQYSSQVNLQLRDKHGNTPLHYACMLNNTTVIRQLLAASCKNSINIQNNQGQSPLHLLISSGNEPLVRLFIQLGANVDMEDLDGMSPLHYACATIGGRDMVDCLLKSGSSVFAVDNEGDTPLHYAVREDNLPVIQLLLSHSQSLQQSCLDSQVPNYFSDCMNIDNDDDEEQLPLHLIENDDMETPLHLAASIKSSSHILHLLINQEEEEQEEEENVEDIKIVPERQIENINIKINSNNNNSSSNSKYLNQLLKSIQSNPSSPSTISFQNRQLLF